MKNKMIMRILHKTERTHVRSIFDNTRLMDQFV